MSIFERPDDSKEAQIKDARSRIIAHAQNGLDQLIINVRVSFSLIWNSNGITPQEILDAFGKDAASLFIASAKAQKLIKELYPDYQFLIAPEKITLNPDGTVTVGEPKPKEQVNVESE